MNFSLITFNCMGLFSFDTLHGFFLSTNIFGRMNKIGELLAKENAEVILLQEVHTYLILNLLKTKLPNYPYIAFKRYLYGPKGGLVIFSKQPLESIEYSNYKNRGSIFNKSVVTQIIRNGILKAKIKDTAITVCNTYLTPNMDYTHAENNRFAKITEAQLRQLTEEIRKLTNDKSSVFVGGDFNTDKKSYLYDLFLKQANATDLFQEYDFPTKIQEFYPSHHKVERLDYLFHFGKTKPKNIKTSHLFTEKVQIAKESASYLSDHIGLKAILSL